MPNNDYVKREDIFPAVTEIAKEIVFGNQDDDKVVDIINSIPAADVEPKRKTGFWTDSEVWIDYENNARETVRCSLCNSAVDVHCAKNYCTYCGARILPEPPKETDGDEQTAETV